MRKWHIRFLWRQWACNSSKGLNCSLRCTDENYLSNWLYLFTSLSAAAGHCALRRQWQRTISEEAQKKHTHFQRFGFTTLQKPVHLNKCRLMIVLNETPLFTCFCLLLHHIHHISSSQHQLHLTYSICQVWPTCWVCFGVMKLQLLEQILEVVGPIAASRAADLMLCSSSWRGQNSAEARRHVP